MTVSNQIKISALYAAIFKRAPDKAGLDFWSVQATANPATVFNTIAAGFSQHPVFSEVYDSLTGSAYVNALYTNILGSAGDEAGVSFWTKQLTDGRTKSEVLASFVQSSLETDLTKLSLTPAELAAAQIRQQTITNKATVGVQFATLLGSSSNLASTTNPSTLAGLQADPAYLASVAVIANVTHVASTASNAIANISVAAASGNPIVYLGGAGSASGTGQTFTLTANTDSIPGTAGDDTINGVLQGANATGTTIQPGDVINGGEGTDTLNITIAGAAADTAISAVQTNSVERVFVNNFSTAGGNAISTDLMEGLTTVGLRSSSADGDTSFTGMRALVGAELRNGAGDLTLTYAAAAVAGTADTQALTVSNVSAGTFTADGAETIAITTELVKSTLTSVASDALKTVVITGDQDLKITNALNFAANGTATAPGAVVDASAFTGKLEITTTAGEFLNIKGGSGNDTFNLGALTKDDVIVGGDGIDTITMAAATLTTQFAKVSGIETVAFTAGTATATMDISKLSAGVNTVQMDLSDADGTDNNFTIGTFSNLDGQAVNLKRTVANFRDENGNEGVSYVITNKVDTASDTVNVTLDAIGVTSIADNDTTNFGVGLLDVGNFETVNLTSKKSATVTANQVRSLTDSSATNLNITGDADLTITQTGTKLTNVNASALDGKLNITLGANKVSVTGGAKDDTFNFAGNFNNDDTVVGGAGKDTLTATGVTGLTATTGKLNTSGVEIITLTTTGNNTLDLTNVVGATEVSVAAGTQTITGLDLATKLVVTNNATLKVTAADATGTNDTLTVEQKLDGNVTNVIEGKAIENLSLILNDTAGGANAATFTVSAFEGNSITVAESASTVTSGVTVALGNLHKNVTSVNTSGVKGTQSASAAASSAAVTFSLAGAAAATVTGSAFADTFNISETGAVTHAITGGDGSDVTNIAIKNGFVTANGIATETVNFNVKAGDSVTLTGVNNTNTTAINLKGGNSLSVFTTAANGVYNELKTFNSSEFAGNVVLNVTADIIDDTVTFTGGASTSDEIEYSITAAGTDKLTSTGIEILDLDINETSTLDLSAANGVTTIDVDVATGKTFTIDKMKGTETVLVTAAAANAVIEAKLAVATGAADTMTFELKDAGTAVAAGIKLKTTDIETVNIKVSSDESISLADLSITEASKFMSLNLTGDKALTISALNADVNVINAAGMTEGGSVIQTGRSGTTAATYTGTAGADTFIMANAADVIDGGAGTNDTLDINFNAILGGIQVDLSSKTDQVTTFNGSANAAVQVGFENVDLAGFTGTFGADITAAATGSKITGTANADIITLGAGVDTITLGLTSSDTINNFDIIKLDVLRATGFGNTNADFGKRAAMLADDGAAINVLTTALDNDAAIITAIQLGTATTASLFVVFNTADNEAQVWFDANPNDDGGEVQVATLAGIANADLAGFLAGNFAIVA